MKERPPAFNRSTLRVLELLVDDEAEHRNAGAMSIYQARTRIAASLLYLEAWTKLGSGEPLNDTLVFIGKEYTTLEAIAVAYPETAVLVERVIGGWREYAAELRPYLH